MAPWIETAKELPPEGVLVDTKIDDGAGGCRNVSRTKLIAPSYANQPD